MILILRAGKRAAMRDLRALAVTLLAGLIGLAGWAYENRVLLVTAASILLVGYTFIALLAVHARSKSSSSLDAPSLNREAARAVNVAESQGEHSADQHAGMVARATPSAESARRVRRFVCNTQDGRTFFGLLPFWAPGTVVLDLENVHFESGHFGAQVLWSVGYSELVSLRTGGLVGNHVILRTKGAEFTLVTFDTSAVFTEILFRAGASTAVASSVPVNSVPRVQVKEE
jgi:hypothetical protein